MFSCTFRRFKVLATRIWKKTRGWSSISPKDSVVRRPTTFASCRRRKPPPICSPSSWVRNVHGAQALKVVFSWRRSTTGIDSNLKKRGDATASPLFSGYSFSASYWALTAGVGLSGCGLRRGRDPHCGETSGLADLSATAIVSLALSKLVTFLCR